MPPRSTCPGATLKGACVTLSTPAAIGAVAANSTVDVQVNVPRTFRPYNPTFVKLSGPLDAGIVLSDVSVTGNLNSLPLVAHVRFANVTAGSITPTATILTIFQE